MLDKALGDALLRLDLTPRVEPPTTQIDRVIDADRRRVKRWTRIAIGLWALAALGAMLIFFIGAVTFPLIAKKVSQQQQAAIVKQVTKNAADAKSADKSLAKEDVHPKVIHKDSLEDPNTPLTLLAKLTAMCVVIGSGSFLVLVLAGLATVLLLHRTRSATLRQINANLMQISEQLKQSAPSAKPSGA